MRSARHACGLGLRAPTGMCRPTGRLYRRLVKFSKDRPELRYELRQTYAAKPDRFPPRSIFSDAHIKAAWQPLLRPNMRQFFLMELASVLKRVLAKSGLEREVDVETMCRPAPASARCSAGTLTPTRQLRRHRDEVHGVLLSRPRAVHQADFSIRTLPLSSVQNLSQNRSNF